MHRWYGTLLTLLLCVAVTWAAWAQDQGKDKPDADKAVNFQTLQKEFTEAQTKAMNAYRAAKPEDRQKFLQEYQAVTETYAPKIFEYATKNPKAPDAVEALVWSATVNRKEPERTKALETIAKDHLDSDKVANLPGALQRNYSPLATKILTTLMEKGKTPAIKGIATYVMATNVKGKSDLVDRVKNADEATAKRMEQSLGADAFNEIKTGETAKFLADAEKLFEKIAADYGNEKFGNATLGDTVKGELYELRNLSVGKTVPEIEGPDMDGTKFKISDYRGKVVMLDFWGHW
jgi:hypothetical protein